MRSKGVTGESFALAILQSDQLSESTSTAPNTSLEDRLAAVEAAISELRKQVASPPTTNWLQQITGSFRDDPAFDEIVTYGRAIRRGDESVLSR